MKSLSKLFIYVCDNNATSGEGQLYNFIKNFLSSKYILIEYNDFVTVFLRNFIFLRDRVLPIYFFVIILIHKILFRRSVLLVNYVPLWNFLNSILVKFGANLSLVNGSIGILPYKSSYKNKLIRGFIQDFLCNLFIFFYPKNKDVFCSTPSVTNFVSKKLNSFLIFPYFLKPEIIHKSNDYNYDIFVYSTLHPIKNHNILIRNLNVLQKNYSFCRIGDFEESQTISNSNFNYMLSKSKLYLSLSYEDAGITGMKAMYNGIPILCSKYSGCAFILNYDEYYCLDNISDIDEIIRKIKNIFDNYDYHVNRISTICNNNVAEFNLNAIKWLNQIE